MSNRAPLGSPILDKSGKMSKNWRGFFNLKDSEEIIATHVLNGDANKVVHLHETAKYYGYKVYLQDIVTSTSTSLQVQVSSDSGANFSSSSGNYRWTRTYLSGGAGTEVNDNSSTTGTGVPVRGTNSSNSLNGNLIVTNMDVSSNKTLIQVDTISQNTYPERVMVAGQRDSNEITNALRLIPGSGTLTSGAIILVGINNRV